MPTVGPRDGEGVARIGGSSPRCCGSGMDDRHPPQPRRPAAEGTLRYSTGYIGWPARGHIVWRWDSTLTRPRRRERGCQAWDEVMENCCERTQLDGADLAG